MPSRRWSVEQVVALAPTATAFAAADGLAVPSRWAALGADDRSLWGRCRGSGREPYDTMVDHVEVGWRCSCPSRRQPCKHALALLLLWVRGHVIDAPAPAGVTAWLAARRPAEAAPPTTGRGDEHDAEPEPPAPAPADGEATTGRDGRIARLRDGLIELDRWLDDRLRTGLADPALARYATWDDLAARLVDARAGALANRVRRLAGVVGARPDWHEVVLAELGVLHLLAQGGRRVPELPDPLADRVATACGWLVRQADVRGGVPDTDTWVVAGRSDTREDRIEVRRWWLVGESSRRWAMVLSFAAYQQALDTSLRVGQRLTADLHRYPGPSVRALIGIVHARPAGVGAVPALGVAEAAAAIGKWWAGEPWADRIPVTIRATPARSGAGWALSDPSGSLALASDARSGAVLLAASGGRPVDVTVEWTADGAVPLTVHLPDRALDVGPTADPSFVSAA